MKRTAKQKRNVAERAKRRQELRRKRKAKNP